MKHKISIKKNIPLAKFTYFKIGGSAKYFCNVKTLDILKKALDFAKKNKLPIFILGGGGNILISDNGFDGLVIKISNSNFKISGNNIEASGGVALKKIIRESANRGLSGLEWAAGIPGTIGGAIRGNAGAFQGSIENIVKSVAAVDIKTGKIKKFSKEKCGFDYRESFFKKNPGFIIWSAELYFKKGAVPELKKAVKKNMLYRKNRHPIEYPSCGSVFKNIHDKNNIKKILSKNPEIKNNIKKWGNKIPAAYLIDKCGLKGMKVGGAMISPKHPNFIINCDNKARAEDVVILMGIVKEKAGHKFGIPMEEEVQLVGF